MIFGLVSGILHLCNIDFVTDPEMEQVIIVNEEEIDYSECSYCHTVKRRIIVANLLMSQ